VNVVCLILNDLNPETRAFAFESARKFVNEELRPNTFIGVFSLDASGLRPVFPFSNNRERLLKAVELAAVNQLPSINLGSAAMLNGLSMQATGNIAPPGGGTQNADGSSPRRSVGHAWRHGFLGERGLREIDALIGLVRQLSPLPFQKTVLLLSTGLTRPPDQLEYWDSLIHQATKGGVTFYAMDVWGLGVCQDAPSGGCLGPASASAPSVAMLNYTAALSQQQGPASIARHRPPCRPHRPPRRTARPRIARRPNDGIGASGRLPEVRRVERQPSGGPSRAGRAHRRIPDRQHQQYGQASGARDGGGGYAL
jgi:hypothetical protein